MKYLLALLLVVSGCANAENKTIVKQLKYTQLQCKQKILPLNIEYAHNPGSVNVTIKFEGTITQFKITSVRGLDGLEVTSAKTPHTADVKRGDVIELEIDINEPAEAAYVVLDAEGIVRGQVKKQAITIPIGEQMKETKFQKTSKESTSSPRKKKKILRLEEN